MTVEQLRYFVTIVDMESYMDAALELNISQSSISKQIQSLERELGVSLFDRTSRKAKLTPEGKKLLPEARVILTKIDHFLYSARKLRPDYKKRITVYTLPFIGYLGLYASFNRFENHHPDYHFSVVEEEEPKLMHRMHTDDFDMIITYEYEYRLSGKEHLFLPVTSDEITLIVHQDNPLSTLNVIRPDDLVSQPLLLMEPYTCISKLCMNYFTEHGLTPDIPFRARPETIFGGAEAQHGAAMITRKQAQCYYSETVKAIPFHPPLTVMIGAVLNKRNEHLESLEHLTRLLSSE